jgi:lauroyl/myristoyl acyltransferase
MLPLLGYWTADLLVRFLPAQLVNRLAKWFARIAFALRFPARRQLELNLIQLMATPESSARSSSGVTYPGRQHRSMTSSRLVVRDAARHAFEHFALSLTDFLRLAHIGHECFHSSIEIQGAHHLASAHASARGVIVLSAHTGNWEWGAAFLAARGQRVHVVARPHPNRAVESFFARRRSVWGVSRLCGQPLWLEASRALRRREWIAMMGDRHSPDTHHSLCAWAAALSRRTGALVLPALMMRKADGRHAAFFEAPLSAEACQNGGYREIIRRHLLVDPGQWCAFEALPRGLA